MRAPEASPLIPASSTAEMSSPTSCSLATSGDSTSSSPASSPRTTPRTIRSRWLLAVVFLVALVLRVSHITSIEHRIWCSGDAYNYLVTGQGILRAVTDDKFRQSFVHSAVNARNAPAPLPQSQTLVDRLQLDGPLYPAYLATALWASGVRTPDSFDGAQLGVTLCNAVVDSFACVLVAALGTLLFSLPIGLLCGFLLALYPGAVISTQQCLSEPLAMFITAAWLLLACQSILHETSNKHRLLAIDLVLGILTGALLLAKSANILLVPFLCLTAAIAHARNKSQHLPTQRYTQVIVSRLLPIAVGFILAILPWLLFNHQVTGNWSVVVDRVPGCNLLYANSIKSDGWETFPDTTPWETSFADNVKMLQRTFCEDPQAFTSLQLRKVARMFGSVWNEFSYPVLGLGYNEQTIAHRLLLLFALAGLLRAALSGFVSHPGRAACVSLLFAVIAFHLVYVPFEAMPRYVLPAMPAIVLLAAFGIAGNFSSQLLFNGSIFRKYLGSAGRIVGVIACLSALCLTPALCTFSAAQLPGMTWLAPWISATFAGICVIGALNLGLTQIHTQAQVKWNHGTLVSQAVIVVVAICTFVSVVSKKSWTEWQATLSGTVYAKQVLTLPKSVPNSTLAQTSLILMDVSSDALAPPISVSVNGHECKEAPIPFASFLANNQDILNGLFTWQAASGRESRSFRQWWCIPVRTDWLRFGEPNEVMVQASGTTPVDIYGDFPRGGDINYLPSFFSFSHNGGYASIQRGDARVMERFDSEGNAKSCALMNGKLSTDDLSSAPGQQTGTYRIRIACLKEFTATDVPVNAKLPHADNDLPAEVTLVGTQPHMVLGNDAASMFPPNSNQSLPAGLRKGTRIDVICDLKNLGNSKSAFVNLSLTSRSNPNLEWHAFWQPEQISLSNDWQTVTFSDVIPDELVTAGSISTKLLTSPYQPELFYTNRKKAVHSKVFVRNVRVRLLPPLDSRLYGSTPHPWLIY